MDTTTITALPTAVTIDGTNDYFPIDNDADNQTEKINRSTFLGVSAQPVDISTVQTLSNKTLGVSNILTVRDDRFTIQDSADVTKQAVFELSGITTATTRTYTMPNASTTLVGTGVSQTLTNKTLTAPAITGGTYDNGTITVDSIAEHTAANGVTIDGLNIKDGKLNTNNSVVTANITDTAVTPAKLQAGTGTGWAWQTWAPTWTNLTVGNGTLQATYVQTGKTVEVSVTLVLGSTSSVSGQISLTLPVTANSAMFGAGSAAFVGYAYLEGALGVVRMGSTTSVAVLALSVPSTYVTQVATSSSVPVVWANGMALNLSFRYQAA